MASTKKSSRPAGDQIRAYLAAQPPATRRVLKAIREAVRTAAPGAVEVFSYGIPGFRLDGRPLVWYAGWQAHVSLYPIFEAIVRELGLEDCETSKGTIRFPLTKPPSAALVTRLVKARIAWSRAEAASKK